MILHKPGIFGSGLDSSRGALRAALGVRAQVRSPWIYLRRSSDHPQQASSCIEASSAAQPTHTTTVAIEQLNQDGDYPASKHERLSLIHTPGFRKHSSYPRRPDVHRRNHRLRAHWLSPQYRSRSYRWSTLRSRRLSHPEAPTLWHRARHPRFRDPSRQLHSPCD